jgi:transmembrane sensor
MAAEETRTLSASDAEALDWVRRLDDPEFADWDHHLAWLEEDPAHAAAFDRMSLLVEDAAEEMPIRADDGAAPSVGEIVPPASANDNAPLASGRSISRWWIGGAVAVAASALAVVASTLSGGPAEQVVRTLPGEHRTLSLADGTTIAMNGSTTIRYAGASAREVALDAGQAWFAVRHDPNSPFAVRLGDDVVRDVGTTFDVARTPDGSVVTVGEGEVAFESGTRSVRLPAGRRLVVYKGSAAVSSVEPSAVGGWRRGRLVYRDATLSDVATDLSRAIGEPVAARSGGRLVRFTGVIVLDRDPRTTFDRVEAATGARAVHGADGWQLLPPTR